MDVKAIPSPLITTKHCSSQIHARFFHPETGFIFCQVNLTLIYFNARKFRRRDYNL
jgi:hypothetical protein